MERGPIRKMTSSGNIEQTLHSFHGPRRKKLEGFNITVKMERALSVFNQKARARRIGWTTGVKEKK